LCTISVYICLFLLVAIYVHVKGGQHDRRFPFLATWHFIAWQCQSVGLNLVFLVSVIFAVSPDVVWFFDCQNTEILSSQYLETLRQM